MFAYTEWSSGSIDAIFAYIGKNRASDDNQLGSPEQDATQVLSNLVFDWSPQSWVCQISQLYLETFHLEPIIH